MSDKNSGNIQGMEQSVKRHYRSLLTKHVLRVLLPVAAAGLFSVSAAQADFEYGGSLSINYNPDTLTLGNPLTIGYTGNGWMTVGNINDGNSTLLTKALDLGYAAGSTGTLTLTGSWTTYTKASTGPTVIGDGVGGTVYGQTGILNVLNQATANLNYLEVAGVAATGYVNINNATVIVNPDDATGTFTVGGANSNAYGKSIGYISVTNGGQLTNTNFYGTSSMPANADIAYGTNSLGYVTVDGAKSLWTNTGVLYVGAVSTGTGKLTISDGGVVTAASASINNLSSLTIDVGTTVASNLNLGTGTITNNGTIRLVAGADAANGSSYTPITAGTWSGNGAQSLGGEWNSTNHTVTVNSAITTTAGTVASMDLYTNQRGIVTDPSTGNSVGLGFQATATSNPITFSATAIGGSELSSLQTLIGTGNSVLSGWSISTTGTTISSTNPVYLSLTAGTGQSLSSLVVYDYNGTSWSLLAPADLAYDGKYASFTALNLNDVAVVGAATPTPIPAAIWLLGSGLFGLVGLKRKQQLTV